MAHLACRGNSEVVPHMVLFPFMSKGHTIPMLQLALLLRQRGVAVTILTTPANHAFISGFLTGGADCTIIDLPFPDDVPGIPPGVQSTDKLPSMSLFVPFVNGIKLMQSSFEGALDTIHKRSRVSCIVSDGFLPWTLQSASQLGIPRLCYHGMGYYASAVCNNAFFNGFTSLDEPITLTHFPWIKLTRDDFDEPFNKPDPSGPHWDFVIESAVATANSCGLLMNSFYELEKPFVDYLARESQPKSWSIGPFCLVHPPKNKLLPLPDYRPEWMHWLDQKSIQGLPVLYVAFGSQARLCPEQLCELVHGLEESRVSYLWVAKKSELEQNDGIEDMVSERGMLVQEWVDQREILQHQAVQGFLSHCGWNSVLEGVCAEVPILAWPMMADQFLNAKMVAEEIKVGLRVNTVDGSPKGFVTGKSLKDTVVQLMEGDKGNELREKVKKVSADATRAATEGGSSWQNLNNFIDEMRYMDRRYQGQA